MTWWGWAALAVPWVLLIGGLIAFTRYLLKYWGNL
jgi:hypothetical protein